MEGFIIKNVSNDYVVKSSKGTYSCKARGKFRNMRLIPLVGDYVSFDDSDLYILDIKKRKNFLVRPSVANVDQAIIVSSVKKPDLDTYLLDKLLTIISFNNIEPVICFTKLDLLSDVERKIIDGYIEYYQNIGYKVVTNEKRENFKEILKGKITVLTGQSGAGKSSLLNFLDSSLDLKTDEISLALNRGKHTTRHIESYELFGGYVVDTPGFSQVDLHEMTNLDIRDNMKEMFGCLDECKYRDCMHIKEDGCRVKELVSSGDILLSRYDNYKYFIENKK
jgi:ribosome biogenesis GTPase